MEMGIEMADAIYMEHPGWPSIFCPPRLWALGQSCGRAGQATRQEAPEGDKMG